MQSYMQVASAGFALVSAGLWIVSALAKVKGKNRFDENGHPIGSLVDEFGVDVVLTARLQSRWSAWAAIAAAAAALSHAIGQLAA